MGLRLQGAQVYSLCTPTMAAFGITMQQRICNIISPCYT